jgi:hypothetical protein
MFDAEIAATLLNRRDDKLSAHDYSSLNLLHEGKLTYCRHLGTLHVAPVCSAIGLDLECLTFADGSHALRLLHRGGAAGRTRWAAIEPIQTFPHRLT